MAQASESGSFRLWDVLAFSQGLTSEVIDLMQFFNGACKPFHTALTSVFTLSDGQILALPFQIVSPANARCPPLFSLCGYQFPFVDGFRSLLIGSRAIFSVDAGGRSAPPEGRSPLTCN